MAQDSKEAAEHVSAAAQALSEEDFLEAAWNNSFGNSAQAQAARSAQAQPAPLASSAVVPWTPPPNLRSSLGYQSMGIIPFQNAVRASGDITPLRYLSQMIALDRLWDEISSAKDPSLQAYFTNFTGYADNGEQPQSKVLALYNPDFEKGRYRGRDGNENIFGNNNYAARGIFPEGKMPIYVSGRSHGKKSGSMELPHFGKPWHPDRTTEISLYLALAQKLEDWKKHKSKIGKLTPLLYPNSLESVQIPHLYSADNSWAFDQDPHKNSNLPELRDFFNQSHKNDNPFYLSEFSGCDDKDGSQGCHNYLSQTLPDYYKSFHFLNYPGDVDNRNVFDAHSDAIRMMQVMDPGLLTQDTMSRYKRALPLKVPIGLIPPLMINRFPKDIRQIFQNAHNKQPKRKSPEDDEKDPEKDPEQNQAQKKQNQNQNINMARGGRIIPPTHTPHKRNNDFIKKLSKINTHIFANDVIRLR